ncbi:hypothetical protein P4679_27235 [Priestia megaterium]|uniref:hypothetical protein n=1 Tax=Priestia megaterium TaxID=1404 RepID=UPI002E1F646E|nr:hypothetical protein [Priestia megaterium]
MKRNLTSGAKRKLRQDFFLSSFIFLAIFIIVAIKFLGLGALVILIPLFIIRRMLVRRYKRDCYILENGMTKEAYLFKYQKTGLTINNLVQYAAYFQTTHNATEITVIDKTFYKEKLQDDYKYTLYYSPKYPDKCIVLEFRNLTINETFESEQSSARQSIQEGSKKTLSSDPAIKNDSNNGSPFF